MLFRSVALLALQILDAGGWLHGALDYYQTGVVDCEMSRLGGGDRSSELKRLWANTFTHWKTMEKLLEKWRPIVSEIDVQVERQISELVKQHEENERRKAEAAKKAAAEAAK